MKRDYQAQTDGRLLDRGRRLLHHHGVLHPAALYQQRDGFSTFTVTVVFAAYAFGVMASLYLPEAVTPPAERVPYRPQRVAVPRESRGTFFAAVALGQIVLSGLTVRDQLKLGTALMSFGLIAIAAAVIWPNLAIFVAGGIVAGAGVGLVFRMSVAFRTSVATAALLAKPESRGEVLAAISWSATAGCRFRCWRSVWPCWPSRARRFSRFSRSWYCWECSTRPLVCWYRRPRRPHRYLSAQRPELSVVRGAG
ncbi:hypothetical protein [Kribbella deserti]|uniref:MFS transporter n=1 Tax=Kribbella deserti TaxID=1926257 RepID=A0ABV6QTF5_9ACTN